MITLANVFVFAVYIYKQVRPLAALASVRCLETHRLIYHLSLPVIDYLLIAGKESHICWKEQHCGGGSGGRNRGRRSLASLGRPRAILRCNVMLLVMCLSPIAVRTSALYLIVATVIDYFSLLVTACHRLFTYHCLAPVLAGKNEHRLILFAGKSEHHLDLVNTHGMTYASHTLPSLHLFTPHQLTAPPNTHCMPITYPFIIIHTIHKIPYHSIHNSKIAPHAQIQ